MCNSRSYELYVNGMAWLKPANQSWVECVLEEADYFIIGYKFLSYETGFSGLH